LAFSEALFLSVAAVALALLQGDRQGRRAGAGAHLVLALAGLEGCSAAVARLSAVLAVPGGLALGAGRALARGRLGAMG